MGARWPIVFGALSSLALFVSATAAAATLAWDGVLRVVVDDAGPGIFQGAVEDVTSFSGVHVFGDSCGAGCVIEHFPPDATHYAFPGGSGQVGAMGIVEVGDESGVEIIDDHVLEPDEADLLGMLGYDVAAGEVVDSWNLFSNVTTGSLGWGISFLYVSTNPFTSTAYTAAPPPGADLVTFEIEEGGGGVSYLAFGEVTTVPEPGQNPGILAGSLALLLLGRLRSRQA